MTLPNLFGAEPPATAPVRSDSGVQTQSLYRKYRPQSFDSAELVGQEHIVRTLRNAILHDRVAHAYLFCGPRGTGKTTTARLLAKAVNCLDPDVMHRPCNQCAACTAIATGATADVIEIDAASNRGIDDIRDLRERVKYAPTQLRSKFYIIDEAHQITGAAANAFLKTLEEPPAHTRFVLATTDPEELLPTIVSRCQRFDFRRIGAEAVVARLRHVAHAESLAISDEALHAIARHAAGSLRDALGLLDQLSVWGHEAGTGTREITLDALLALLGVSRNERVERLVEAIASRDAAQALGTVNEAVEAGEDPRQLNRQLVAYLRVLMFERAGGSPDADDRARELAAKFDLATLGRLARTFSETDYKIRRSPYAQLPLEIALVDAIVGAPEPRHTPAAHPEAAASWTEQMPRPAAPSAKGSLASALKARSENSSRGNHLRVVPSTDESGAEPAEEAMDFVAQRRPTPGDGELTIDQIAELWPRIRSDVKAVNRRIEALLASIDPIAIEGARITLAAAYDFHRRRMCEDEVRGVVEQAISRIVGRSVTIDCVMRGELGSTMLSDTVALEAPAEPPPTDAPPPATIAGNGSSTREPTDEEMDRQRLQAAKNIFDGEEI